MHMNNGDPAKEPDETHEAEMAEGVEPSETSAETVDGDRSKDREAQVGPSLVTIHPKAENREKIRILEALLFAATEPLDLRTLSEQFDADENVEQLLAELEANYAGRGVHLKRIGGCWAFRTAEDLGYLLEKHTVEQRRLSRAALETLSIIAYHQPTTRAEIEEIRGVSTSKGTLDVLLETGWVKLRGRRRAPGRPVTYGTSPLFLEHFGFETIGDLPGMSELKGAGLLSSNLPANFAMPIPTDLPELTEEEDPLEDEVDEEDTADLFDEPDDDEVMDKPSEDG